MCRAFPTKYIGVFASRAVYGLSILVRAIGANLEGWSSGARRPEAVGRAVLINVRPKLEAANWCNLTSTDHI